MIERLDLLVLLVKDSDLKSTSYLPLVFPEYCPSIMNVGTPIHLNTTGVLCFFLEIC